MALTTAQQALLLFKKLLGLGQTTASREFFNETGFPGRSAVYTSQIWTQADSIPTTAPALSSSVSSGVVQYWQDITLGAVAGTTTAFTSSLLVDAIPFNFGDGTSYNYTLKDSTNGGIAFGQGDWIVDTDAGLVTFYSTVPANMPPKISFYKYVGAKGFTSSSVSITGSFSGNLTGTSSFATTALTASYVSGAASTWDTISGKPTGLVSSSVQINTGSFTGSFVGTLTGTSSWATNAISSSYAPTILPAGVVSSSAQASTWTVASASVATSASYAVTSSLALNNIMTASVVATTITFTKGDGSTFPITIAQSGSVESSSYATIAGSATSASYATTASYALNGGSGNSFPFTGSAIISGSLLVTGSVNVSGGITGSLLGTSSWATNAVTAITASYAESAVGYINFPNGLTVTGSTLSTGGFTGSLLGTSSWAQSSSIAISSSFATTASAATSITFIPATASFATSASFAQTASIANGLIGYASFPQGLIVTGSTLSTGGFTGSLLGTASWATNAISSSFATTALTASYFSGSALFENGLIVTGSVTATSGFLGPLFGTASVATRLTAITFTTPSIVVTPSFVTVTSGSQHLTNGAYAVSCTVNNSELTNYRLSGMVSWTTASASVTVDDEIFLHRSGYTTASVFLRTFATSGTLPQLQLGSDMTLSSSVYVFTFTPTA